MKLKKNLKKLIQDLQVGLGFEFKLNLKQFKNNNF